MNAHATHPCETDDDSDDAWRRRWLDHHMEMLDRLAEFGMEIAAATAAIARQAKAEAQAAPAGDEAAASRRAAAVNSASLAYDRAARAVRMACALQARLLKEDAEASAAKASDDAEPKPVKWTLQWLDPRKDRAGQSQRVERLVRRVAEGAQMDREAVERLETEAAERLKDADRYGDLMTRPIGEVLAQICRDLGLEPDWGRLAEEPWAQDEIKSGAPNSPFAPWMARPPPADPHDSMPPGAPYRRYRPRPAPSWSG